MIEQALLNLLQNAIDFSPEYGIIQIVGDQKKENYEVRISDQGPGIPDYALSRIFDKFYSLPRPDSGKKSTGLGLSFVKEVALLHGGNVTLENITPKGGRSLFTLPL